VGEKFLHDYQALNVVLLGAFIVQDEKLTLMMP
jgi:hypothetical protein